MEQNNQPRDWGNARFRPRHRHEGQAHMADDAQTRFVTGLVIFVAVALVFPWYSYWVQSRLVTRELETGLRQMSTALESAEKRARADAAQYQRASAQAAQVRRETSASERVAAVRVMGAKHGSNGPVAVVYFGSAGITESTERVCQQAGLFLGRSVTSEVLRVQRYRGNQPATDAGHIRC